MVKPLHFSIMKRIFLFLFLLAETLSFGNVQLLGTPCRKLQTTLPKFLCTGVVPRLVKNGICKSRKTDTRHRLSVVARSDYGPVQSGVGDENFVSFLPSVVDGSGGFPSAPIQWQTKINYSTAIQTALILSDKRSRMREIFDLELSAAAGLVEMDWGLWKSSRLMEHDELACLASTRAQIKILAGTPF
jgi:hypothetical protein